MAKVSEQLRTDYRSILRRARNDGTDQAIGNRYPWQCREAIQELFDLAKTKQATRVTRDGKSGSPVEVLIVTASFPNYVFGCESTVKSAQAFLEHGGKLQILIWASSPTVAENDMYRTCKRLPGFSVKKTGTDVYADKVQHFMVVDGTAYRLEIPHKTCAAAGFDDFRPEIPARINFNDPTRGGELVKLFVQQWSVLSKAI